MEKVTFADVDADPKWWLLEPDLDYRLIEFRKDIADHFGWGRECQWFLERPKVEELYDRIESGNNSLLRDLDEATDVDRWVQWITQIVDLVKPIAPETPTNFDASPVEEKALPVEDAPPVVEAPAPAAVTVAKPSIFRSKSAPAADVTEEEVAAPPVAAAPASTPADVPAAKPSIFRSKSAPASAPTDPAGASDAGATAADGGSEHVQQQLDAAVKEVLSHLEPDRLPGLAGELGVSEEELARIVKDLPDDFEKLIAAEAAKLAGGAS